MILEDRLQYECCTWFHNVFRAERGFLCRTENKTTKGAREKGLGMVKGMSDLKYTTPAGTQFLVELKVNETRHEVQHLKQQLAFIDNHSKRGAIGMFIFELEMFQTVMTSIVMDGDINVMVAKYATHSLQYIKSMIDMAELKGLKTVKLDYNYREV